MTNFSTLPTWRWPACLALLGSVALATNSRAQEATAGWRETGILAAEEAHQAAAADQRYVYAIANRTIGQYDRKSGRRTATSSGEATHLNSGFFWRGKLYCAHSNYPAQPERSEILVLDPASMKLTVHHHFANQDGSLTWAVWHGDAWWCSFAFYDKDNRKSYLARFNEQWQETARWIYPMTLIDKVGRHSISGGVWYQGQLLVTDHEHSTLYRLEVPRRGAVLKLVETQAAPFAGQGIAHDPVSGGLVGIVRKKSVVIFAEREKALKE